MQKIKIQTKSKQQEEEKETQEEDEHQQIYSIFYHDILGEPAARNGFPDAAADAAYATYRFLFFAINISFFMECKTSRGCCQKSIILFALGQ